MAFRRRLGADTHMQNGSCVDSRHNKGTGHALYMYHNSHY